MANYHLDMDWYRCSYYLTNSINRVADNEPAMTDKQYLEVIQKVLGLLTISSILDKFNGPMLTGDDIYEARLETERRIKALKAQEDNIKSEMWKEKNPMVFDTSIGKWRERTPADDEYAKDVMKEFGL